MPIYTITVVNAEFQVANEQEAASLDEAHQLALTGALAIGTEEVAKGKPFFGAEVSIVESGGVVDRFVVSVGASPLQ